jgi:hypothetical protein
MMLQNLLLVNCGTGKIMKENMAEIEKVDEEDDRPDQLQLT